MSTGITIRSPAKINLGLRVLGRRRDGYHEIDTLMVPIDLFDIIEARQTKRSIQVNCPGYPDLTGPANLAYRAAELFFMTRNYNLGVSIKISKNIPIQAGLGGGSSNAASTLLALRQIVDPEKPMSELFSLATQLGADVPFFLHDGPCRARGIGHKLEPVVGLPSFWVVLACAPFGLKTRDIFENLNYPLTLEKINDINNTPFSFVNFERFAGELHNDLQPVAERLQPSIRNIREEIRKFGAVAALMTGSGPTVFGLFQLQDRAMGALTKIKKETGWRCLIARGIRGKTRNATE